MAKIIRGSRALQERLTVGWESEKLAITAAIAKTSGAADYEPMPGIVARTLVVETTGHFFGCAARPAGRRRARAAAARLREAADRADDQLAAGLGDDGKGVSSVSGDAHDSVGRVLSMLRRMIDMPVGTIGFEAIGEVEDDDWERWSSRCCAARSRRDARSGCCTCSGPSPRHVEDDAMQADTCFRRATPPPSTASPWSATRTGCRPALRGLSILLPGKAEGFHVRELAAREGVARGRR